VTWQARPSTAPRLVIGALALGLAAAGVHQAVAAPLPPVRVECRSLGMVIHPDGSAVSGRVCEPRVDDLLRRQLVRERRAVAARVAKAYRAGHATARREIVTTPRVRHALALAAAAYGQPYGGLVRVATCESTLRPWATNGRYVGLMQFGTPLWSTTPFARFPRTDPYASAMAASYAWSRGNRSHWECR